MQVFLVGGAVRDELLHLPVIERDWVVVGATPQDMTRLGYKPVGKEFPVFLHPKTKEEYALARTERKTGRGYKGFTFYADPTVTLEEDLKRRDLTINAIAKTAEGKIIDPYHGVSDLKNKILRHVSLAFKEDPVRILRIARFAARFPDFTIAEETMALLKEMVVQKEVQDLVAERVWQEWSLALGLEKPLRFFSVLEACGAREILFPTIFLQGQGIKVLDKLTPLEKRPSMRFAVLVHDLTAENLLALQKQYKIPNDFFELGWLLIKNKEFYFALKKEPHIILDFLLRTDALRRPGRFADFIFLCEQCFVDRQQWSNLLNGYVQVLLTLKTDALQEKKLQGEDFANALRQLRLECLEKLLRHDIH